MGTYIASKIPKISCLLCKSELTINMFERHYGTKQCLSGGKFESRKRKTFCDICNETIDSSINLGAHKASCKKKHGATSPHWTTKYSKEEVNERINNPNSAKRRSDSIKQRHAEGRYKESNEKRKGTYTGPEWTDDAKEKHSKRMREVAKNNPESYSSSNRGRTKQIEKYGIKFQGSWELEFYKFCVENKVECIRNYDGFPYIWNGERTYFPDFYLPELDSYVEIKGYKIDRDVAKWSYFPHNLIVIQKHEINLIKKNLFKINDLY